MDAAQRMHCSLGLAGRTRERAAELVLPLLLKTHCITSVLDTSFQAFVSLLLKAKYYPACKLFKLITHAQGKTSEFVLETKTGAQF